MKTTTFIILFCIVALFSCKDDDQSSSCQVKYDETSACTFNDLQIHFDTLVADSRCPKKVDCVWAGEVGVQLIVNDSIIKLYLTPGKPEAATATVGNYSIRLTAVEPYPEEATAIPLENYIITLDIMSQ